MLDPVPPGVRATVAGVSRWYPLSPCSGEVTWNPSVGAMESTRTSTVVVADRLPATS